MAVHAGYIDTDLATALGEPVVNPLEPTAAISTGPP